MSVNPEALTAVLAVMQILLAVVAALIGWLVKGLFEKIKSLESADKEVANQVYGLREALPTNYVRRDDFGKLADGIHAALRRIEDKLDNKVDKP